MGYDFKGQRSTGDKETRAKPMSAAVANGNVRLLRGNWNTDYIDEMSSSLKQMSMMTKLMLLYMLSIYAGLGMGIKKKLEIIV